VQQLRPEGAGRKGLLCFITGSSISSFFPARGGANAGYLPSRAHAGRVLITTKSPVTSDDPPLGISRVLTHFDQWISRTFP